MNENSNILNSISLHKVSFDGGKTFLDIESNEDYLYIQDRCRFSKVWMQLVKQMVRDNGYKEQSIRHFIKYGKSITKKTIKPDPRIFDQINFDLSTETEEERKERKRGNPLHLLQRFVAYDKKAKENDPSFYKKMYLDITHKDKIRIEPILATQIDFIANFQIGFTTISSIPRRMQVLQSYLYHCDKDLIINVSDMGEPLGETKRLGEEELAAIKDAQRALAKEEGWEFDENWAEKEQRAYEQKKQEILERHVRLRALLLTAITKRGKLGKDYEKYLEGQLKNGILLEGPELETGKKRFPELGKDNTLGSKRKDVYYYDETKWNAKFDSPTLRKLKEIKKVEMAKKKGDIAKDSQRLSAKDFMSEEEWKALSDSLNDENNKNIYNANVLDFKGYIDYMNSRENKKNELDYDEEEFGYSEESDYNEESDFSDNSDYREEEIEELEQEMMEDLEDMVDVKKGKKKVRSGKRYKEVDD